jgi:hypothetical protein
VKRACPIALLALLLPLVAAHSQDDPLSWINDIRRAAGAPAVAFDTLLSETASQWAQRLAEAGVLSHRGADGSSALDRYRAMGGTDVHVGEILGAGPRLVDIERGWRGSDAHRALALAPAWTHAGWGRSAASRGNASQTHAPGTPQIIVVVLFCEKLVQDLTIRQAPGGLLISGSFTPRDAARALLYSGLDAVEAQSWDAGSRRFSFQVPDSLLAGYLRLGYISPAEKFTLTNAFTLPRGTGFPAAPDRSSIPGASP